MTPEPALSLPRIAAVTCVKNEGPFLLEWIAYHRLLGVSDFLFFSNDCDDGTDTLLDLLAGFETLPGLGGRVVHLANPAEGRNYQMEALRAAKSHDLVAEADWVWVADVDEFPDIAVGNGSFGALIAACGDVQAISIPFLFFANGGVQTFEDRPVIGQFDRCHNPDLWHDQTAIEVKTLVRRDFPLRYYGAHRPFAKKGAEPRWCDASGRAVPEVFARAAIPRRTRKFPARGSHRFAHLNHYALRSLESYLVKRDRGDVNRDGRVFELEYWQERNDSALRNPSIQRQLPALEQALAKMKAEPGIAAAHAHCVARHREKISALLQTDAAKELAQALMGLPELPPAEAALCKNLGIEL